MQEKDALLDLMRGGDDSAELLNVKFFRGSDDVISAHDFRKQFRSALVQEKMRTAVISADAPRSNHPQINLKEFVTSL